MATGRPIDIEMQEKNKAALLSAARELLCVKPYKLITIRELAEKAGTHSPMISYYFGSKCGLIEALIKLKAQERQSILNNMLHKCLNTPENAIEVLVDEVITMLNREIWLFRLIHDQTLDDSTDLKPLVVSEFSKMGSTTIGKLLVELKRQELIKIDIDFKLFMTFFVSLIITPITNNYLLSAIVGFDETSYQSSEWKTYVSERLKCALSWQVKQ